jgi:hypothetical protein
MNADREDAKARYRAFEALQRAAWGAGQIIMAAGDSAEVKRAAWRARNDRRIYREKNSLGRIVLDELPHDPFVKMMLDSGFYVRPHTAAPTFKGAAKAFDRMIRQMMAAGFTRVTMERLLIDSSGEKVVTTHEAKENVERNAKD